MEPLSHSSPQMIYHYIVVLLNTFPPPLLWVREFGSTNWLDRLLYKIELFGVYCYMVRFPLMENLGS